MEIVDACLLSLSDYAVVMHRLRLKGLINTGQVCHFGVTHITARGFVHTHDFHELFWVQSGQGEHFINGETRPLRLGMIVLVRGSDRHGFAGTAQSPLAIANIAFSASHWQTLFHRYWPAEPDPFTTPAVESREYSLAGASWAQLQQAAEPLWQGDRSMLALDRFLLALLPLLHATQTPGNLEGIPAWLRFAVREMSHPARLPHGTAALVELAGRSPEHVARMIRKYYARTPTDLVNEARLDWAGRQLSLSCEPIADIAAQCGLSNVSHFYRLFRRRFSVTPHEYRARQQLIVRGT